MKVINPLRCFEEILKFYSNAIITSSAEDYANRRKRLKLPVIPIPILESLLEYTADIFKEEPVLLKLNSPFIIVGDIHGHLLDLFRILKTFSLPPKVNYLFLGDLVDRGEFSTETVSLFFILKSLFPKNVYIVRGNHEFSELCDRSGFYSELLEIYDNPHLCQSFEFAFSHMPLAAVIDDSTLCIHGGIGPSFKDVKAIEEIKKPISDFHDNIVSDILWSDPSEIISMYIPSNRGTGNIFGQVALESFLENSNLKNIIRGHQCVQAGCETIFDGKLTTVFSASNYCGSIDNKAGVLLLNTKTETSQNASQNQNLSDLVKMKNNFRTFDPLPAFGRKDTNFLKSESEYQFSLPQHSLTLLSRLNTSKINQTKVPAPAPRRTSLKNQSIAALTRCLSDVTKNPPKERPILSKTSRETPKLRHKSVPISNPIVHRLSI
ncbi:Ser/Thr protein phosphatase [Tritrichomonas foetus]|uniref:Serine/threonine-protein phosphatase n=1 Tax=Tritrichomonas foetus TaxID=1144522 RepID=A0A1J4KIC5_9EUKA|nr:Ser/Thr protein phosphatase [Tritrichomonas foetus]|eukprot:OHT09580.1 Ser/Thr protein phosphatase [Tritrichomonas foetus]